MFGDFLIFATKMAAVRIEDWINIKYKAGCRRCRDFISKTFETLHNRDKFLTHIVENTKLFDTINNQTGSWSQTSNEKLFLIRLSCDKCECLKID